MKKLRIRGVFEAKRPKKCIFWKIDKFWAPLAKSWKWHDPVLIIWYHYPCPQLVKYKILARYLHFCRSYGQNTEQKFIPKNGQKSGILGLFLENCKFSPKKDVFRLAYINLNLKYYLIQIQKGPYHFPKWKIDVVSDNQNLPFLAHFCPYFAVKWNLDKKVFRS